MDSDRKARQDARIRGSGSRQIQVEPLKIHAPLEEKKPKLLQSALIDDGELATLSRFRNLGGLSSSQRSTSTDTNKTKQTSVKSKSISYKPANQTKLAKLTKSVKSPSTKSTKRVAKPSKNNLDYENDQIKPQSSELVKNSIRKPPSKIIGSLKSTFLIHSPSNKPSGTSMIVNPFSDDSEDDLSGESEKRSNTRTYKSRSRRSTIEFRRKEGDVGVVDKDNEIDENHENNPTTPEKLSKKPSRTARNESIGILDRPHFPVKKNADVEGSGRRAARGLRSIPRPDFNEEEYTTYILDSDDDYIDIPKGAQDDALQKTSSRKLKSLKKLTGVQEFEYSASKKSRKRVSSKEDSVMTVPKSRRVQKSQTQPIPLTKSKILEALRLLDVDLERLDVNEGKNASKVSMLDVLLHLVKSFLPDNYGLETSAALDESSVNDSLKMHLLYHLSTLLDYQSSIYNLLEQVKAVEKEKTLVRDQLLQLRQEHRDLGNEMNEVRRNLLVERANFERLQGLENAITVVREREREVQPDLYHLVQNGLVDVDSIVNPHHGIYQKLLLVNEILEMKREE